jgi:hypothetical protein
MNRKTRLIFAAIVTLILAITATTVWAGSSQKEGSLGKKIHDAHGTCNGSGVNMGDATFVITVNDKIICTFEVVRVKNPNQVMGGAPEGKRFLSDGFTVYGPDKIGMLEVCFAYPPQVREKNAQIFALFGNEQTVLPTVISGTPAQLCAATPNLSGTFAMIGDDKDK